MIACKITPAVDLQNDLTEGDQGSCHSAILAVPEGRPRPRDETSECRTESRSLRRTSLGGTEYPIELPGCLGTSRVDLDEGRTALLRSSEGQGRCVDLHGHPWGLVTDSQSIAACDNAARRDDFTLIRHRCALGATKVNTREIKSNSSAGVIGREAFSRTGMPGSGKAGRPLGPTSARAGREGLHGSVLHATACTPVRRRTVPHRTPLGDGRQKGHSRGAWNRARAFRTQSMARS